MAQIAPDRRSGPCKSLAISIYMFILSTLNQITIITTFLCFLNPYTRMSGTELVYNLFSECHLGSGNTHSGLCAVDPSSFEGIWPVVRAILVAMSVKACLTVVTFGIKVPAGIFIPSLGVGACAGRVMGIIMQWLQWQKPGFRIFACKGDTDCELPSNFSFHFSTKDARLPGIIPGLYAMVGATATLSGVTVSSQKHLRALPFLLTAPIADYSILGSYHV